MLQIDLDIDRWGPGLRHYEDICCFAYLGVLNFESRKFNIMFGDMIYPNMFGADMIS